MKKIVLEGTKEQLQNVLNLISDFDEERLPKFKVVTEKDIIIDVLGQYVSDDVNESYDKLLKQNEIDSNVMADDVVMMWEPLQYRYTVAQLLDEVTYGI